MASRRRGLSKDEIQCMLFDDDTASESDDSQSEVTSSDDDHLSDVENSEN